MRAAEIAAAGGGGGVVLAFRVFFVFGSSVEGAGGSGGGGGGAPKGALSPGDATTLPSSSGCEVPLACSSWSSEIVLR